MTDRPLRRWPALPLVAALLLAAACSKPLSGTPVAVAGADRTSTAESTASDESAEPSTPDDDPPADGDLGPLVGTWTGEYTCQQGETGLKLAIEAVDDASVQVLFEFFPVEENPAAKKGSYQLIGTYSSERLMFRQDKWIEQPPNYQMVDLEVTSPVEPDVDALSGNVLSEGCKGFSVRRD